MNRASHFLIAQLIYLAVAETLNGEVGPCGEAGPHFFFYGLDLVGWEEETILALVTEFEGEGTFDTGGFVDPIGCVSGGLFIIRKHF